MGYSNTNELLNTLIDAYFQHRDIEKILSCVSDDIEWIGTENDEYASGKDQLRLILEKDFTNNPLTLHYKVNQPTVQIVTKDVEVITVTGNQLINDDFEYNFFIRGTLCALHTHQGWLVNNIHTSVTNVQKEKAIIENKLETEKEIQSTLLASIPGGIAMYRLKKDGRMMTDYISRGLAKICGYEDSQELMKVIKDDSRQLVYPEDLSTVINACKNTLEKGKPINITYRVFTKNGDLIRITLNSVIMKNISLNEDDVAVFYAVQTLVSEEENKTIEDSRFMFSLLNAVPAGIGIYEINDQNISLTYMNNAFYKMVDSSRENRLNYVGKNATKSIHPNDLAYFYEKIKQAKSGADSIQLELRLKKDDGKWIWVHVNGAVVERKGHCIKMYTAFYDCTDMKEKQIQLIQNQQAVESAEKQGSLSIWTYNIDRKLLIQQGYNDVRSHLGYSSIIEDVPNCFVQNETIHPDDVEKYLNAYQKIIDGKEKSDVVYRIKNKKTGIYHWVHMFYQRMDNNDSGERVAAGFSIDVEKQQEAIDRYQVEQRLRHQMYKDAELYMEYNLTTNRYEGQNNIVEKQVTNAWESPSFEEYKKNMNIGIDDAYVDKVIDKMYCKNLLNAFREGKTKVSCEFRSKERKNKPALWYSITATMIQSPDTDDIMAFIYMLNIEKDKQKQLAIESSMIDGVESVMVVHIEDKLSRIVRSNSRTSPKYLDREFVYDDQFVYRSHQAVIEEEREFSYNAALLSTVLKELKTKDVYQYSVSMLSPDRQLKRRLFRFRFLDDRKADIIMSISDITEVYLEEQEKKAHLQATLSKLQEASGAKAEFYSRMSHDMRTPMNGILGMAELSQDEDDILVLKENIRKIRDSGEYLLSLVNDTLDIQRIESGKLVLEPKIVYVKDVVENILDMVKVTAKTKGVTLKYTNGNTELDWYIKADALRLKQIFVNLLSNAIKFTPKGGTVEWEFKLLKRDGMVSHDIVYVRDTGVGMSQEFLDKKIFKPFSQESNSFSTQYAGSGLGLSIAKSLVELMNGKIEVDSQLGVGSTFAVYLDFERIEKATAKKAISDEINTNNDDIKVLQDKRILLVEDHPINAEIAIKILEKVGCHVLWAKNGQEAVTMFETSKNDFFDLIIMDIRMPVMNGIEATQTIRALDNEYAKRIPIIAMTANSYEEDIRLSIAAGMNVHLSKPIESKVLYRTLISIFSR